MGFKIFGWISSHKDDYGKLGASIEPLFARKPSCCRPSQQTCGSLIRYFPNIGGPQYRSQNTTALIMRTPKRYPQFSETLNPIYPYPTPISTFKGTHSSMRPCQATLQQIESRQRQPRFQQNQATWEFPKIGVPLQGDA